MPANRKPPGERQDNRDGRAQVVQLPGTAESQVPAMPVAPGSRGAHGKTWLVETRDAWEAFWSSPVAGLVDVRADSQLLLRWLCTVDEYQRVMRELRKVGSIAVGSTGQPVVHPLARRSDTLVTQLVKLEEQLGMSPRDRARIGVQGRSGGLSPEDLRRQAEERTRQLAVALTADDEGEVVPVSAGGEEWVSA